MVYQNVNFKKSYQHPTTYIVTAANAAGCVLIDSISVTPIICEECPANAGYPQDPQEICSLNGEYSIFTEPNFGIILPAGF